MIESTWRWKTLVVVGGVNEKIAATIGITESTVKLHRGQVMRKMLLKSFQELVRMANKLGIPHTKS
jgi:FixJ family two-component response regulator